MMSLVSSFDQTLSLSLSMDVSLELELEELLLEASLSLSARFTESATRANSGCRS